MIYRLISRALLALGMISLVGQPIVASAQDSLARSLATQARSAATLAQASAQQAASAAARAERRVKSQNIIGQQWGARMQSGTSATTYTWHQTMTVEAPFTRVRFMIPNSNASDVSMLSISVAVSDKLGTGTQQFTPSTGIWRQGTWDGGSASAPNPAGVSQYDPNYKWTDWIYINSIPRTDGGTLPILMVRVALAAGPVTFANYDYSPWATASGFNNGRFLYTFRYTGNAARPDNASSFTGGAFAYPLVMGYEAQIAKPAFTFLLSGDSITEQAVNGSGGNFGNGWNWMAVSALRAANPGLAIGYTNTGISSSDTASFFTRLKKVVAAGYNYDALVYSPFSPNDPTPSASTINLMQQRLNGALGVSATTGKPTILWTGIPNDAQNWDATADGFRLSFNAGVLGYASAVPVINMEPVISNGATPARIKSGLTTDGTHPNEAGHAAMATQAVPVMQSVITSVVGTQLNSVDLRDLPPTPANDNAAERMAA